MRGANALYEGHRLMLPGLKGRATATCQGCRYYALILDREENKPACLADLDIYLTSARRVPPQLRAEDFIWLAGKEALVKAVEKVRPERQACGLRQGLPAAPGRQKGIPGAAEDLRPGRMGGGH
ncbi:hypothetical protein [Neomoorella mulderi]|uniref:Uncharacterized protein n=1 Tax=Moorella mulderi DSM 14980 TaxID=1122241 RepID=A0A151ATA3_9FIRM|nr:hypothetical protein [Moorella mulderi]KYH30856.1 hypothetical protein MOMUL_28270 [Moorella mulderi DSM 14980]